MSDSLDGTRTYLNGLTLTGANVHKHHISEGMTHFEGSIKDLNITYKGHLKYNCDNQMIDIDATYYWTDTNKFLQSVRAHNDGKPFTDSLEDKLNNIVDFAKSVHRLQSIKPPTF